MKNSRIILVAAAAALFPMLAQAHHLPGEKAGFTAGLIHPVHGLDHILAMVAVGLWATQLGKRAVWMVPAAFVSLMSVGGVLGMTGFHLPMVETGIIASVIVLGTLIAAARRLPLLAGMMVVGFFAIFHGFAHGSEMPSTASGLNYLAGFVISTALLHACGICLGLLARRQVAMPMVRLAGAAIVVGGIWLAASN